MTAAAIVGSAVQGAFAVAVYWFAWQRGRKAGLLEAKAEIQKTRTQIAKTTKANYDQFVKAQRERWALDEEGPAA